MTLILIISYFNIVSPLIEHYWN